MSFSDEGEYVHPSIRYLRFRIESELGWSARAPYDLEVIDLDQPS